MCVAVLLVGTVEQCLTALLHDAAAAAVVGLIMGVGVNEYCTGCSFSCMHVPVGYGFVGMMIWCVFAALLPSSLTQYHSRILKLTDQHKMDASGATF